jgi:N-acetylneuraminic acid mutarotase
VYARAGGASFWSATDAGYEEWLWLDAAAVRSDGPVAVWEVTGATLEERGDAVEMVDARGAAGMRVTAPLAYAAGGRPVATRLAGRGARVELWVEADGEAVLVDPGWIALKHSMSSSRNLHTATTLLDGRVLVAGGRWDGVSDADVFDPATKSWSPTKPMTVERYAHTATLLGDGRVLVAGGTNTPNVPFDVTTAAELFDLASNTWTATQYPMMTARAYHTAVMLADGHVLVAGGLDWTDVALFSAEVYDPSSQTWTLVQSMTTPRRFHTMTRLLDGRVLVTGGVDDCGCSSPPATSLATVEMFDPSSGTWTQISSMHTGRDQHTATLLSDGRVLVVGGSTQDARYSAELFDPVFKTWTQTPPMMGEASTPTATLLLDGRVLIVDGASPEAQAYDPSSEAWAPLPSMSTTRLGHAATLLSSGRVLVAGGDGLDSAEVFDPTAPAWKPVEPMMCAREEHTATLLDDGGVLVVGGDVPVGCNTERFDPLREEWAQTQPMAANRWAHTATLLGNGNVLVAGGANGYEGSFARAEVFDAASQTWVLVSPMGTGRTFHTATLLLDGRVLITGGETDLRSTSSAEVFDPSSQSWTPTKPMNSWHRGHTATLLLDGRVLVVGGDHTGASEEVYDPSSQAWVLVQPLTTPRSNHTATLLSDGRVLVVGGIATSPGMPLNDLSSAEVYDPSSQTWTPSQPMRIPRSLHTATLLSNGHVLVAGGRLLNGAEIYEVSSDTWTSTPPMSVACSRRTATRLLDGRVLVAGGLDESNDSVDSAEIYSLQPNGTGCSTYLDCLSGFCTDGVCCDQACSEHLCEACSEAHGATADGTCTPLHPECVPFACSPVSGACETSCQTIRDCASGYACAPSGQCVPSSPGDSYFTDTTCALRTLPPRGPSPLRPELSLALLAALATLRRTRRSTRRASWNSATGRRS